MNFNCFLDRFNIRGVYKGKLPVQTKMVELAKYIIIPPLLPSNNSRYLLKYKLYGWPF